ncbi:hypothetical protein SS50377_23513 [Spironucleus salmonicida]|uniref:Uncharacterized protein n=1 Tax=Spironucleus salmonicida TaxID=348837 RepID=V6LRD5_9EUKA|nr:hypothetical protein SS50377_23513 [Spironucleus salmonicida]|eukprot:EST46251.1 Hypothetical protein SS50377_13847 [Spironucleus salmonicida]
MSQTKTLFDMMKDIRQNISSKKNSSLNFSQLSKSSMSYQAPQFNAIDLQASQLQKSKVEEELETQIIDLELENRVTQTNLNKFIDHVNDHMKKLSDATISMQTEVETLRAENKLLTDYIMKNGIPTHQCTNQKGCDCCYSGQCYQPCDCCLECNCNDQPVEESFCDEQESNCGCEEFEEEDDECECQGCDQCQ